MHTKMMVLVCLSTNNKSTLRSHDKSYDSHMRVGEWPEATTPCTPLKHGNALVTSRMTSNGSSDTKGNKEMV